jgi:hypothetical protein
MRPACLASAALMAADAAQVGLTTNDSTADWERLKHAGVEGAEFVEGPTDYSNPWVTTLKDPEGNLVQRFQPSGGA